MPVWAASLAMALGEFFSVQKLAEDLGFIHADDVSCPAQLGLQDHCFNAGGISSTENLEVRHLVLPANLQDITEAAHTCGMPLTA